MMSDVEEPPAKLVKIETAPEVMDSNMEETQEEWLSEGVLTDDDCHPTEHEKSDSNIENTSQGDSVEQSLNDRELNENNELHNTTENMVMKEASTDATDNNLLDSKESNRIEARIDELDEFLLKNDGEVQINGSEVKKVPLRCGDESDVEESPKHTDGDDDDGHNTDDLLRMLGGDDPKKSRKRVLLHTVKKARLAESDNDSYDDDIFEGAEVRMLKVAKNAVFKKVTKSPQRKTYRDDRSSSDNDSDQEAIMKRMFRDNKKSSKGVTKSTLPSFIVKNVVRPIHKRSSKSNDAPGGMPGGFSKTAKLKSAKAADDSFDEEIDEAEYLEEDNFDLDDDLGNEEQASGDEAEARGHQQLRRPEQMDEELPSDMETEESDYSFYDELPSSESEDAEEWFTLDLRGERAGEYVPLLGARAAAMLGAERSQVSERLATLRRDIGEVSALSKHQALELESARRKLIEIDAKLSQT